MFKENNLLSRLFIIKEKSIEPNLHLIFFFLFLFSSIFITNCAKEGNKSDKSDKSDTLALLGFSKELQTSTNSDNGTSDGGILPPIPPVVGPPATPGQPLNAPILNNPQTQVHNAPVAEDPSGFHGNILIDQISFQLPVHNQTTITAYIGKRNMKLEQDGTVINATNFRTITPLVANGEAIWFRFKFPSDQKQKLILVARNEFGSSSKEIDFSHNRNCIGAPLVPTTIGDCNHHCFEINNIAGQLEFKSKLKHDELTYLEFDILGVSPKTGAHLLVPNFISYIWEPADLPLQPGVTTVSTILNQDGKENVCMELQSIAAIEDGNGTSNVDFFHNIIRLE